MKTRQLLENARSRRMFLRTSAGTVGAAVLASTKAAQAGEGGIPPVTQTIQGCSPAPRPIPDGFNARTMLGPRFPDTVAHLFLPAPGAEPSTMFDFNGDVAILNIHGTDHGGIKHRGMGLDYTFEFCRGHLLGVVLDHLLEAVHQVDVARQGSLSSFTYPASEAKWTSPEPSVILDSFGKLWSSKPRGSNDRTLSGIKAQICYGVEPAGPLL